MSDAEARLAGALERELSAGAAGSQLRGAGGARARRARADGGSREARGDRRAPGGFAGGDSNLMGFARRARSPTSARARVSPAWRWPWRCRGRVSLVESQRRKCEFVDGARARADRANAPVVCARVEEWEDGRGANDAVVARALAPQPVVLEYAAPLLALGGSLVDWRGREREAQESAAPPRPRCWPAAAGDPPGAAVRRRDGPPSARVREGRA